MTDTVTLTNGARMPLLGFGTWQIKGEDATRSTAAALEAGYRHVDTAHVYGNEGEVGRGLASVGLPRDEVFVTTKLPPHKAGEELATLEQSLELLGLDHVDLWLIHWPADEAGADVEMWRRFVEARDSGLTRDIGVSNFGTSLLRDLLTYASIKPAVLQVELHPYLTQEKLLRFCKENGIAVTGFATEPAAHWA